MEFRTKREAERVLAVVEENARDNEARAARFRACGELDRATNHEKYAAEDRTEAASIRALLPGLEDDKLPDERFACNGPACGHAQHMHTGTNGECIAVVSADPHATHVLCPCDAFRAMPE